MPEVHFNVQLPGGEIKACYSPSTIVRDYFKTGQEMTVEMFRNSSREALHQAGERVRQKFGYFCSAASAQLEEIEEWCRQLPPEATIRILEI